MKINLKWRLNMPTYDYFCGKCRFGKEVIHTMKESPKILCNCGKIMNKMIGTGLYIAGGLKGSVADHKESEHTKKVKDFDRAIRSRKKAFGVEDVGNPSDTPDPMHIIKRGRALGGQEKDVDRQEFIKAAAKDDHTVEQCIKAIKK